MSYAPIEPFFLTKVSFQVGTGPETLMSMPARVVRPPVLVRNVIPEVARGRISEILTDYVNNHPEAFKKAYWDFKSIRMYGKS